MNNKTVPLIDSIKLLIRVGLILTITLTSFFVQKQPVHAATNSNINANLLTSPSSFKKKSPANAATKWPTNITFSWGTSSGSSSYKFCINTSPSCIAPAAWISTSARTQVTLSGLTQGKKYYWQVQSNNDSGTTYANGSSTAWWSLTIASTPKPTPTNISPTPQPTATSVSPTPTATMLSISPTPTLTATSGLPTPTLTPTSGSPTPTLTNTPSPTQGQGGNTYYVATNGNDANPGTLDQPWKTIQKAANTMVAGDTVNIRNGTYREEVDLTGSTGVEGKSGNATQGYISYIGESRDGVIIDGTGLPWGSGFMSGVIGRGARVVNYIFISNMTIQNFVADGVEFYADKNDGTYPRAASNNIILDNLKVHDNAMGGIMFCGGEDPNAAYNIVVRNSEVFNNHGAHHGIKFSGDPRQIINGDHIHDSIIENNLVYNNDQLGIHNSSGNYNIIIRNNIVHDNGRQGIAGNQVWDSIYANNTVYSNGRLDSTSADGIVLWSSRSIIVTGNKIYSNPGYGIEMPSALADGKPANPIIINNLIYNNLGGIQISAPVSGGVVYNNTLASNTNVGLFFYSTTAGNTVKNNIFYQNGSQLWDSSGNIYDDNLYYPNISFPSRGAHDISGDPLFIDPFNAVFGLRDYHLKSTSPAIDTGYNLGSLVTNDYAGNPRPLGNGFDISAYEYPSP